MPKLTPLKEEEEEEGIPSKCPGAPAKTEEQTEHVFTVPPRRLGFEREEIDDSDDDGDTDSDDGVLPELDLPEILFLHKQLKLVDQQHAHLAKIIQTETKNVRAGLRVIRRAKRKSVELENQSWSINSLLGRVDNSDYIGLK